MKKLLFFSLLLFIVETISAQDTLSEYPKDTIIKKSVKLDEVEVVAPVINQNNYGTTFRVTQELKDKASSPIEMLNYIDGITYSELDNTVKVRTDSRVLLLVEGVEQDKNYIMSLSPSRIAKIEVINVPAAKYVAKGYKYVINYKLVNDWTGHDLYVQKFNMLSINNNGDNNIANEQPYFQYKLTNKKIDFRIGYAFADIHWNYPLSYQKTIFDNPVIETTKVNTKSPNDLNFNKAHSFVAGLDYHISPTQSLFLKVNYLNSQTEHSTSYSWKKSMIEDLLYSDILQNNTKDKDFSTALIYRAKFSKKWNLHAALGYNYLDQNSINSYLQTDNYHSENKYNNNKNYFRGELDLTYQANDKLSFNAGYIGTWNEYKSFQKNKERLQTSIDESRQHTYLFADYSPFSDALLHIGCSAEHISRVEKLWNFLPQLSFSYVVSNNTQLMFDYTSKMIYPKMYQLLNNSYEIDEYIIHTANPDLSPSREHSISIQGTFWNNLALGFNYNNVHNFITDLYIPNNDHIIETYTNAKYFDYSGFVSYNWNINKHLKWQNIIQISYNSVSQHNNKNHINNITLDSQIEYWVPNLKIQFIGEYLRNMQKVPQLQGWKNIGQDYWMFALQKSFLKNSLFASVSYIPPIHTGVHSELKNVIETCFYKYKQSQDMKTYDNLFLIRLQFRFTSGKKTKSAGSIKFEFENEEKETKGLL